MFKCSRKGHLGVLKWAKQNGCSWDEETFMRAAVGNHLHVIHWALENDCPFHEDICSKMAQQGWGGLEFLKWARQSNFFWNETNIRTIARESENDGFNAITYWLLSL